MKIYALSIIAGLYSAEDCEAAKRTLVLEAPMIRMECEPVEAPMVAPAPRNKGDG